MPPATLDSQGVISRIRYLLERSRLTQAAFARSIGLDAANFSKHLSGRLPVTEGLVNRIAADLGVSKPWLRDGLGTPYQKSGLTRDLTSQRLGALHTGTVAPVYDIDVTAGTAELSRLLTQESIIGQVQLPQLHPDDVIVRVSGESMTPVIRNGAYIAIHPADPGFIIWGQIYVVVLDSHRMVKYVRRSPSRPDECIVLQSANPDYDDIEVRRDEVRALYQVDAILSGA